MNKDTLALQEEATKNPFRFYSFEEIALIFGFGKNVPGQLAALGAPVCARKMNPQILLRWIQTHPKSLEKLRSE